MIPLVDIQAQNRALAPDLERAFARVLDSGRFVLGEEVEAFEEQFAAYCGTRHAIAVSSGTSALHMALLAAGIGPGDEVITTPMTFVATVAAILYAGARPVLVDIDPVSRTIDAAEIERVLTPRSKAIMPVHLHGGMADMAAIATLADTYGLVVIEDAAQAHGAEQNGRRAGSIGVMGCFSFYPGKNLGACGEGGAVVTNNAEHADTVRTLRDWGQRGKYNHVIHGFNYRMEAIQAALLSVKLPYLERWTEARRQHAAHYGDLLRDSGIGLPAEARGTRHVFHAYAVELSDRDSTQQHLQRAGIATGIHYPVPVHLQPAYASLGYRRGDFPVAERFARSTLSLPLYPELQREQVERVVHALCTGPVLACA